MSFVEWQREFSTVNDWKMLESPGFNTKENNPPHWWVICTQEDTYDSPFTKAFHSEILGRKYRLLNSFAYKGSTIQSARNTVHPRYHVHLSIFIPFSYTLSQPDIDIQIYHHTEKGLIKLVRGIAQKNNKMSEAIRIGDIMFIGSHFPFYPFDENYVKAREQAFLGMVNVFMKSPSNYLFMLGDMNFRSSRDAHQPDIVKDQLQDILDKKLENLYYMDFAFPNDTPVISPTCKMAITRKPTDLCTNKLDYIGIKDNYPKSCFNAKRTPSLCDRILYVTKPQSNSSSIHVKSIEVLEFGAIRQSDHNAVYAEVEFKPAKVEINSSSSSGGGTKRIRMKCNGKTYKVRKDAIAQYIMYQGKQKVYVKNMPKGSYTVVSIPK